MSSTDSKMNTVTLQINSHFQEQDSLEREVRGKYSFREARPFTKEFLEEVKEPVIPKGEARVMYSQVLVEGEKPVPETLTVVIDAKGKPLSARIHRSGSEFELFFVKGVLWETFLDTPAGALKVGIETRRLDGLMSEKHIDLTIRYEMRLGQDPQGETTVHYSGRVID